MSLKFKKFPFSISYQGHNIYMFKGHAISFKVIEE
jgi:hypothetical protein